MSPVVASASLALAAPCGEDDVISGAPDTAAAKQDGCGLGTSPANPGAGDCPVAEPGSPRSIRASSTEGRVRRIPQAMVVLEQVTVPPGSPPGTPLVELLQALMPGHCGSATAAKRALRRRLILRVAPEDAHPGPSHPAEADPPGAATAPTATAAAAAISQTPADSPRPSGQECLAGVAGSSKAEGGGRGATGGGPSTPGAVGERPNPRGVVVSVLDTACPGDVLQLLARCGTGILDWVGPSGIAASVDGGGSRGPGVRGRAPGSATDEGQAAAAPDGSADDPGVGDGASGPAPGEAAEERIPRWRRRRDRHQQAQAGGGVGGSAPAAAAEPAGLQPPGAGPGAGPGVPLDPQRLLLVGLPVAYEDEHLAVVIKPPGIDTQGSGVGSVQGRLKYCLKPTPLIGALNRPQQVHRLDAPTGGLLLVAKTHQALRALAADLHHRRMSKRYCSLVKGDRRGSGTIDMPLSGKACVTHFQAVAPPPELLSPAAAETTTARAADAGPAAAGTSTAAGAGGSSPEEGPPVAVQVSVPSRLHGRLTKIHLWPHTGRTHQLRKHMAYTGTPMLGEPRYRGPRASSDPGAGPPGVSSDSGATVDPGVSRDGEEQGAAVATATAAVGVFEPACTVAGGPKHGRAASGSAEEMLVRGVEAVTAGEEAEGSQAAPGGEDGTGGSDGGEAEDVPGDVDVCRPPVDAQWVLSVATAAAASGGAEGDVLSDGSPVSLCLWAVELRFRHPVTGRQLQVDITEWADALYDDILRREGAAATTTTTITTTTLLGCMTA